MAYRLRKDETQTDQQVQRVAQSTPEPVQRSGRGSVLAQNDLAAALYDNLREPCYRPVLARTLYDGAHIGGKLPSAVPLPMCFPGKKGAQRAETRQRQKMREMDLVVGKEGKSQISVSRRFAIAPMMDWTDITKNVAKSIARGPDIGDVVPSLYCSALEWANPIELRRQGVQIAIA